MKSREELEAEFKRFDDANPKVWELFCRFARAAIAAGRERLSVSLITERIRWETAVETRGEDFKLNNNHRAYYARKFNELVPRPGGGQWFETRDHPCTRNSSPNSRPSTV